MNLLSDIDFIKRDKKTYEYLKGEEILLSNQKQIIKQAECFYLP